MEALPANIEIEVAQIGPQLALDMAAELRSPEGILEKYGFTVEEFRAITETPLFKRLYIEAKEVWNAGGSPEERIQARARIMAEESLPALFNIVQNDGYKPADRMVAWSTLAKAGHVAGKAAGQELANEGRGINITIDLGEKKVETVIEAPVLVPQEENDAI